MARRGPLSEATQGILELTRRAHQEYRSQRRVLEASWGVMSDDEWLTMEFEFLDPRESLSLPGIPGFQRPRELWILWLIMMTLGPPSVNGTLQKLKEREDLRQAYHSLSGSDAIPSNSTVSTFLRRMGLVTACCNLLQSVLTRTNLQDSP